MTEPSSKSPVSTVALLTSGGLAPCLSAAVGGLIQRYTQVSPATRIIAYENGYAGLLTGRSLEISAPVREQAARLLKLGGSPIGNSRVKLTNVQDVLKRGLITQGQDPLQVAAEQLTADGVKVLHTIGGDDTNTTAGDLAAYLAKHDYDLTVVGLPKTIDNDVIPIRQSLGAWSAAEQSAIFARHIVAEHSSNPRMLVVHEVMGRGCGWLTAATTRRHHEWVAAQEWVPGIGADPRRWDAHAVYVPEEPIDLAAEGERLRAIMDELGCVNIFLAEGAGAEQIVAQLRADGQEVPVDPFGHVQLDKVNPGAWFGERFAATIGAEKVMVQKSGYFARSAAAGAQDIALIAESVTYAVDAALRGESGVVGQDEERGDELAVIEFPRIAGGKKFDISLPWFTALKSDLGQP